MFPSADSRIRLLNQRPLNPSASFVLYWMIAARRPRYNFGLQRAADLARELRRPLVILEALRCDYPWASDRLHRFVIDGMRDNARAFAATGAAYYPYVEPSPGAGGDLLPALGAHACAIVTDWYPGFRLDRLARAGSSRVGVRVEAVDSNGLVPVTSHGRAFPTARGYRAFVQRELRQHLRHFPVENPLDDLPPTTGELPGSLASRWPAADLEALRNAGGLANLPVDHSVKPASLHGGHSAATKQLRAFVATKFAAYGTAHNDPDADVTSHLSPYLHFGHISAHEVFSAVMTAERWTTRRLAPRAGGAREGWWNVSPSGEHFLDQLVVWRELAFNGSAWTDGFEAYESLPAWARATLEAHLDDRRSHLYDVETLDAAATHDDMWNAAQRQLVQDGWCHGYMRMLWGKKILAWSAEPVAALAIMEQLMNRYSLDGRDPVSYANYGWVLGRYDRPWPERPVFGTVRCMTSESAKRKLKVKNYLQRYSPGGALRSSF